MGAENYVPFEKISGLADYLQTLKKGSNIKIIGLELTSESIPFYKYPFTGEGILVLGNEEKGIRTEVLQECDEIISIPMYGRKHSLNVSSAFSIIAQRIQENSLIPGN